MSLLERSISIPPCSFVVPVVEAFAVFNASIAVRSNKFVPCADADKISRDKTARVFKGVLH
jgi:hypothetical protein